MNSNKRYIYFLSLFTILFLCSESNGHSVMKFDYEKILDKNYKTSLEFMFDPELDYDLHIGENDPIRKNYHNFKETELYLMNGARMKCYTPSKTNKLEKLIENEINTITRISDEYAYLFLKDSKNLCYNTNIKEWFYKLCPTNMATQVLMHKKKNETTGMEYTESWLLGQREGIDFNITEIYLKETNDTVSRDIQPNPFVITEDKIARIYNHDLSILEDYDVNLEIEYELEELKKYEKVQINKYTKTVEDYLQDHPDIKTIPVQRRIIKSVNKHLVLLENPFPSDGKFYNLNLNIIKHKITPTTQHSSTLFVYHDYIYCSMCEFLIYYNVGDSFFIKKNEKYANALKSEINETTYKARRIVKIIDNKFLKVEKPFPRDYNGLVIRNNNFVIDSFYKKFKWILGKGIVKIRNRLIIGQNTKFIKQFKKGDMVVLFNMNKVAYDFYHTHTNPKLYEYEECIVDKIISDNLLLTKHKCSIVYNNKGDYFIGKPFDSDEEIFSGISNIEKNISIIDYDTFENLNLNYDNKNYLHGEYLFHPGLIINSPNDTVIRMKLTKINSMTSYIRILFGTDMNNYNYRKSNKNTDIELIIYSQTGVMIKKVNDVNNKNIQFYDTQLRTLFNDAIHIDLILKNNAIYFSTSDDNMETSIKIKYPLDSGDVIKYIYFDIKESDNAKIKDIEKFNLVENQFLLDIFVFEKKLTLSEDAYWIEELKDGDYCDAIDSNRKTIVEYRCDKTGNSDISISSVTENNTCQYKYNVVSRHFCNPLHLMKYQIDAAVTITKCVAINNIYNFKSEDYFRGVDLQ